MSNFLRVLSLLPSLHKENVNESISRNSLFSSLHPNQFASQAGWNFLTSTIDSRKAALRNASSKISRNYPKIILRESNKYVE